MPVSPEREHDWYADHLSMLKARRNPSEADVSDNLIRPVLHKVLAFKTEEIDAQPSSPTKQGLLIRPDFVCTKTGNAKASAIVEVKKLKTNLMKRTSRDWTSSPAGQMQHYLNRFRKSGDGTWGIVTNGTEWIVTRREGDHVPPHALGDIKSAHTLTDVHAVLEGVATAPLVVAPPTPAIQGPDWLEIIATAASPQDFVDEISAKDFPSAKMYTENNITYAQIGEYQPPASLFPEPIYLACLQLNFPDGIIAPHDITAECLDLKKRGAVFGVAYIDVNNRDGRFCRGFVLDRTRLRTTALINPRLPGSRAERHFVALAQHARSLAVDDALNALSSTPLHRRFHEEISAWFKRGVAGPGELRHLIRIMFVYLLQHRGILPDDALWRPGVMPKGDFGVHRHIEWLFTRVLAIPVEDRVRPSAAWKKFLSESVPYLNGSLFSTMHLNGRPQELDNDMYLAKDGLLTILSGYDWTLCDRSGYESESAIDPSMLGELFERLVLVTEGPRLETSPAGHAHRKMPGGSYYTPQDIADEMAADALARWLCAKVPAIRWSDARATVHPIPADGSWKHWNATIRNHVLCKICDVTVFDPCCGSGAFTLAMLGALRRARGRLRKGMQSPEDFDDIIGHQLFVADIHPLAVLITRLRLFIALMDAHSRSGNAKAAPAPLPNLETRCVAANTLHIDRSGQEIIGGAELAEGISKLRNIRQQWTTAHRQTAKVKIQDQEANIRERLREIFRQWGGVPRIGLMWISFRHLRRQPSVTSECCSLLPRTVGTL